MNITSRMSLQWHPRPVSRVWHHVTSLVSHVAVWLQVLFTSIEGMASCDLPRVARGCLAAGIGHQYRGYGIMWPPSCRTWLLWPPSCRTRLLWPPSCHTRLLWPPSCRTRLFGGRYWSLLWEIDAISMDTFVYAPSQWETTLHCNIVSHWLGAYTKWSLHFITKVHAAFLYTKLHSSNTIFKAYSRQTSSQSFMIRSSHDVNDFWTNFQIGKI